MKKYIISTFCQKLINISNHGILSDIKYYIIFYKIFSNDCYNDNLLRGTYIMKSMIKTIFQKNTELIGLADKVIHFFREQQYDKALTLVAETIDDITYIVETIMKNQEYFSIVSAEALLEMITGIITAKKNKDFVLLADLYEMQLLNFLSAIQKFIINKEGFDYHEGVYKENIILWTTRNPYLGDLLKTELDPAALMSKGYRVEITSCGLMTLGAEKDGEKYYLHTNNRVTYEAFLQANHWYKETTENYIIYGFGFGYHIAELRKLAKLSKIEVYESDINILQLACIFTDLKPLLTDVNITIHYDPDYQLINERLRYINSKDEFKIHYPSLNNVKDRNAKEMLEKYVPWSKILEYC